MSREQTGQTGSQKAACEFINNHYDALGSFAPERFSREEQHAISVLSAYIEQATAPTVSGGEGWEEIEERLKAEVSRFRSEAKLDDNASATSGNLDAAGTFADWATAKRQRADDIEQALALIAVARGGGALPPATPSSVPTEREVRLVLAARAVAFGDDATDYDNLRALDRASEAYAADVPWDGDPNDICGACTETEFGLLKCPDCDAEDRALAKAYNRKLGGDEAQPSEPNPLPTEGHGAAVLGNWPQDSYRAIAVELNHTVESLICGLPDLLKSGDLKDEEGLIDKAARTMDVTAFRLAQLDMEAEPLPTVQAETAVVGLQEAFEQGYERGYSDADANMDYRVDEEFARWQPPVSTGEQPGMSEGGRE